MVKETYDKHRVELNNLHIKCMRPGMRVLDFGCGSQKLKRFIQTFYPKLKLDYHGYDNGSGVYPGVKSDGPYKGKFDLIVLSELIEHLELSEFRKLLKEFKGCLNPHGIITISTPNIECPFSKFWSRATHIRPHAIDGLVDFLDREGYKVLKTKRSHKLIHPMKRLFCFLTSTDPYSKIFLVTRPFNN